MEPLSDLTRENLILKLKSFLNQEREMLTEILDLLKEVDKRNLYLEMGYPSLFEFCVGHLGYGEAAAYRRIQAMRLVHELPDLRAKITDGVLNMTHLSQAQSFFKLEYKKNKKSYSAQEKIEIISKLENKSKQDSENELAKISPNISLMPQETITFIANNKIILKTTIDHELFHKLKHLKSLFSHKNPNMTYAELIDEMARRTLRKIDPLLKPPVKPPVKPLTSVLSNSELKTKRKTSSPENLRIKNEEILLQMGIPRSRNVSPQIRRMIWQKYGGVCSYQDPLSKQSCGSTHQLQIDHIFPFAEGGLSQDPENLRLLCSKHNRWSWTENQGH